MTKVTTKITLEGNFFRRDPGKTIRQNVRTLMDALAEWMDEQVSADIASHAGDMPFYTGTTKARVVGRTESTSGKRWGTWAVVSANTAGLNRTHAIRVKAAAATIERRWHPFRRVKQGVYRARPLITADLTKGLN